MPEYVNHVKQQTGEVIGYVAEWHTHPLGMEGLSSIDEDTIESLIKINRRVPIPTSAVIVTKEKILPYIFE